MMHDNSSLLITYDEYIRAAPDAQLSSSQTHLLSTLLSEEDQHDYNQIRHIQLSHHLSHTLHQLSSLLHLSSSASWMATILLKTLIHQQHPLDLLTLIASLTLSHKYQDSLPQTIDYHLIAHYCQIQNIQLIHDAELHLLDLFSYDICVTTPDHFFSYLSNLTHQDHSLKQIIEQARSSLSNNSLSSQTLDLLHSYPSSIVALSLLICNITSNTFIIEQIKSFLHHKKDPSHYFEQLLHCTAQLQRATSS